MLLKIDPQTVKNAVSLLHPDGELFEIRLIGKDPKYAASGIFSSADTAVNALSNYQPGWNKDKAAASANIYISINPPTKDCYSLVQRDRFVENVAALSDSDIENLSWLFIDFDPERRTGISASDEELELAHNKSGEVYDYLKSMGFNEPIAAMSGNGYHLMYRLPALDNTEDNVKLIENTLKAVSERFSDDKVKIDIVNFNPSRICKLWGTLAQKGANTAERPHRMSSILYVPESGILPNTSELLQKVTEDCASVTNTARPAQKQDSEHTHESTDKASDKNNKRFNVEDFISKHGIAVRQTVQKADGEYFILESCLFDPAHTGKDASIIRRNDGTLCYHCFHNSCADKSWRDVRLLFEPDAYSTKKQNSSKADEDKSERTILLTPDTFQEFCDRHGYKFMWDVIKHEMTYHGFDQRESVEHLRNNAPTILQGQLKQEGYRAASIENICGCISVIGTRTGCRYNAILDLIDNAEWDGKDRLEELFNMWKIPKDDDLSRILITKWLKQCICLLHNDYHDPFSADIALVFIGGQGAAKTRFFEHLAMINKYYGEGKSVNPDNKDSVIEATSVWICELGEIGSTMRKDLDKVKAFMTLSADEYRTPYARTHERHPRLTSFCGTVNDEQFLLDQTGNRRWATIKLPQKLKIDFDSQIKPFNSLQLWAQINCMIESDLKKGDTYRNCFRLTQDEQDRLTERNNRYTKPMKGFVEIDDILYDIINNVPAGCELDRKLISSTDFMREHSDVLHNVNASQVGQVLKKLGYDQIVKKVDGKTLRGYELPYHKKIDGSTGYTVGDGWKNSSGGWVPPPYPETYDDLE